MDLLAWLEAELRPMFLSDLRLPAYRPEVLREMEQIEDEKFPLDQWCEAAGYLFCAEGRPQFPDVPSVKAYCRETLENLETGPPVPRRRPLRKRK